MARRLDRMAQLWEAVADVGGDQVGFCLDTCHAHAGGERLVGLVDRVAPSPGGSTWCTSTTAATGSTPAPTGTPTSVRANSTPTK